MSRPKSLGCVAELAKLLPKVVSAGEVRVTFSLDASEGVKLGIDGGAMPPDLVLAVLLDAGATQAFTVDEWAKRLGQLGKGGRQ